MVYKFFNTNKLECLENKNLCHICLFNKEQYIIFTKILQMPIVQKFRYTMKTLDIDLNKYINPQEQNKALTNDTKEKNNMNEFRSTQKLEGNDF